MQFSYSINSYIDFFYELTSSWRLFWFNVVIVEVLLAVLLLEDTEDDIEDEKELSPIDVVVIIVGEVKEELIVDIDAES